jgi:predicted transposase YdaD
MKTDHPIYLFLSAGPEAFRVLTGGRRLEGDYRFCSLTIKGLERRLDGIFEPEGHTGPAVVVEFQGQSANGAWYNLLTKVGLYGEQHPERDVLGIGVFLRGQDVPRNPTWASGLAGPLVCVALDQVLPDWLAREPNNPYVAVFGPLMIKDDAELRARAQALWQTVQTAPVAPEVRNVLAEVLEYWFFERFRGLTAREIWAMLNLVTPIQETRAYQSIFEEGEARGVAKGEARGEARGKVEGKASTLKRLLTLRFGPLPAWAERRIDAATLAQLDTWVDGIFAAEGVAALIGPEDRPA